MGVLFGRQIISLGDQNGDRCSDILVGDTRFSMHLYYGGALLDSVVDITYDNTSQPVNLYDINGDFRDDFSLLYGIYPAYRRAVYYGGNDLDTSPVALLGTNDLYGYGPSVRGYDVDGNGVDELITCGDDFWSLCIYDLNLPMDSSLDLIISPAALSPSSFAFAEGLITGDFNGDGYDDLAASLRPLYFADSLKGQVYFYWGGPSFDTIPDLVIPRPGSYQRDWESFGGLLVNLGDFNGDGYDDVYAAASATTDTAAFIYFGGPGIDSIPNLTIPSPRGRAASAGDINNDGYPDLITSLPTQWSGVGWVYLYYGGPDADSLPDFELYINELPGYKTQFGMDVAGIGDFNSDGIDDFAFSCVHAGSIGTVYIYAGFDGSTSTGGSGGGGVVLPVDFELFQNYPNPFNPSTTISFSLPEKSSVTLTIHNVLGQRVKTLMSCDLSAGMHSVDWDGTNDTGSPVVSGVYWSLLRTPKYFDSKKMVLLR
jgi:hypothetical protein